MATPVNVTPPQPWSHTVDATTDRIATSFTATLSARVRRTLVTAQPQESTAYECVASLLGPRRVGPMRRKCEAPVHWRR